MWRRTGPAPLPVKGILDLLGIRIASLISTKNIAGVRAVENDLIVNPERILPSTHIRGNLTDVQLKGNEVVVYFGAKTTTPPKELFQNYMAFRGASLRFGKLTMND